MAYSQVGMPSAAALRIEMDAFGAWLKRLVAVGVGLAGETTTAAYYAQQARVKISGDGATDYGIDNGALEAQQVQGLSDFVKGARYDAMVAQLLRGPINTLEQFILQTQPSGWSLTAGGLFALDAALTRLNATATGTPTTPAGTLSVAADTGGAMPAVASGSAPRVKVSWVGAYDYLESVPTAAAAQVAIAAPNSAYTIAGLTGNVPTGVYKMRVYRQQYSAGSGDPYYWLRDVDVTAGTAVSAYLTGGSSEILLTESDLALRLDIQPPSYAQALALPEFATAYALIYGSMPRSATGTTQDGMMVLQSTGMLSPRNVALNPTTLHLGYQAPIAAGELARWVATAFTAGAPQLSNDYARGLQGFAGAAGSVQARVTATLDGTASLTDIDYSYIDATHPTPTTGTISGPKSLTATVGDTVDLEIPAGRIVTAVTDLTVGTATTGTFVIEAIPLRSI